MQVTGHLNSCDEPVIRIDVGGLSIELIVDTGFNGSLLIPSHIAHQIEMKFEGPEEFLSVTGDLFLVDAYSTEIDWLGTRTTVSLATGKNVNEALLGSRMLKNCRLTIDYKSRSVIIIKSP